MFEKLAIKARYLILGIVTVLSMILQLGLFKCRENFLISIISQYSGKKWRGSAHGLIQSLFNCY